MADYSPADLARAIAAVESGGSKNPYSLLGPVTSSGDRAYGKYQIMGKNVPTWTQEHFGRSMTPQEFLSSPEAQDATAQGQLGKYAGLYGPQGAAGAWLAGPGGRNNMGATDQLGTSVGDYIAKFNHNLNGGPGNAAPPDPNKGVDPEAFGYGGKPAPGVDPNVDPEAYAYGGAPKTPDDGSLPAGARAAMFNPAQTGLERGGDFSNGITGAGAALMSIYNPAGAAALNAGRTADFQRLAATKPQFGVIGEDLLGKKYGWINPWTQTITGASGAGGGGGAALGADLTNFQNLIKSGETDPTKLNAALPDSISGIVQGLRSGIASPNALGRGQSRTQLMAIARMVDPTFNEQVFQARQHYRTKMADNTATSVGGQKNLLSTSLEHLVTLADSAEALDNSDGALGSVDLAHGENAIKNRSTANAAKVVALENAGQKYSGEIGKLYSGSQGGGVQERNDSRSRYKGGNAKAEFASALETDLGLLSGKARSLEAGRNDIFGPNSDDVVKFVGPEQQKNIERVQAVISRLRGQQQNNQPAAVAAPGNRRPLSDF